MSDTKLCKDCKHYLRPIGPLPAHCKLTIDPVTGGAKEFCSIERGQHGQCGPSGRNWEAKPVEPPRRRGFFERLFP